MIVVGALGALAFLLAGAGAVAYWRFGGAPGPLRGSKQDPAPALVADADPTRGSIALVRSGGRASGPELEVAIEAPAGATEMQLGFDPTFTSTPWLPVSTTAGVTTPHVGYQMLFGRFRTGEGSAPSPVSVDAVIIDPTFSAATSSELGLHRPSWARPLSSRSIVVRIEAGRIERGAQQVYDFDRPPPGDDVSAWFGRPTVTRDGEPYGIQVDGSDHLLRPYDRLIGRPIDGAELDSTDWSVTADGDTGAAGAVRPIAVERVSRPAGAGLGHDEERVLPLVHDVVLRLPTDLVAGTTYTVTPPDEVAQPVTFTFDPMETISPAVHVNQNGYGTGDPLKVGYLSGMLPGIGDESYEPGTTFRVIDVSNDSVVTEGQIVARPRGDEYGLGDLTGVDVFEADFSTVGQPGRYRLCVDGVGCSETFAISDRVWLDLTVAVARAMYHQRSGVALGPPYTAIARPRPYHPDDGMVVRQSDFRLMDSFTTPLENLFGELVDARTEVEVPEAWGGHFDAGDWDRRIQHLYYVRSVAELVELAPERYATMDLGIPESGDAVPDLLDEGLWTLDVYLRLQGEDGSIRGGIEASEHPQADSSSWTDDLAVFAFAPDPWSSYLYAGVAAQVASVLDPYDPQRAATYAQSALRAAAWAEEQPPEAGFEAEIAGQRAVAAAALYRLTGDQHWHDLFVSSSALDDSVDAFLTCNSHAQCDAGWIYLMTDEAMTDPAIRSLIEQSFIATADEVMAGTEQTSFGWAVENRFAPLVWGLGPGGSPSSAGLLRAYHLTGEERYRTAALRSAAVTLGANPSNTVYITGVGRQPVSYPVIVDVLHGGLPVWAGTPIYGPHRMNLLADDSWIDRFVLGPGGVEPLAAEVPYLWQWFDVSHVAVFNEFTVFQSHAEAIYAFGLLAAGP